MKFSRIRVGCVAAVLAAVSQAGSGAETATKKIPAAKNVIIMIADGGGFNAYKAGSLYQYGRTGRQVYDQPEWTKFASRTAQYRTSSSYDSDDSSSSYGSSGTESSSSYGSSSYGSSSSSSKSSSKKAKQPSDGGYDPAGSWDTRVEGAPSSSGALRFKGYTTTKTDPTDSAAGATAMAVGRKTRNGRINYIPEGSYDEVPATGMSIAEIAKKMGKVTGVVTSVQWSDATPACFGGAHASARASRMEIAHEMLNSDTLDLIMGAGHPEYDGNGAPRQPASESDYDAIGGPFQWNLLKTGRHAGGWTLIESKADFEKLMSGPTPKRVLGTPHVPVGLQHERQTRDWNEDGVVDDQDKKLAPVNGDPRVETVPTLPTMAKGALNMLSRNRQGFFLLIEGGAVDKASHANHGARMVEEAIEFNKTIEAVVEWVETHSSWNETLVIITADHETGFLWGMNSDQVAYQPLVNRGAGKTPGMLYHTGGHSNSLVPLRARGAGAAMFEGRVVGSDPMYGRYVDNTSIYDVMKAAFEAGASRSSSHGDSTSSSESRSSSKSKSKSESTGSELLGTPTDSGAGSEMNNNGYDN